MQQIQYQESTSEGSERLRAAEEGQLRLSTGIPSRNTGSMEEIRRHQFSQRACPACGIFLKPSDSGIVKISTAAQRNGCD